MPVIPVSDLPDTSGLTALPLDDAELDARVRSLRAALAENRRLGLEQEKQRYEAARAGKPLPDKHRDRIRGLERKLEDVETRVLLGSATMGDVQAVRGALEAERNTASAGSPAAIRRCEVALGQAMHEVAVSRHKSNARLRDETARRLRDCFAIECQHHDQEQAARARCRELENSYQRLEFLRDGPDLIARAKEEVRPTASAPVQVRYSARLPAIRAMERELLDAHKKAKR
jgi:hypothetical protein